MNQHESPRVLATGYIELMAQEVADCNLERAS